MDGTTNFSFEQINQMFGNNIQNNEYFSSNQMINQNNNNNNFNNMGMNFNYNMNQMLFNFYLMMKNQSNNINNPFMMNNKNNNMNMLLLLMNMMNNQNNNSMNNMNFNQFMQFYNQMINNNNSNNNNNNYNNVNNNVNTNRHNNTEIDDNNYINIIFILQYDGPRSKINVSVKDNESFGSVLNKLIERTKNNDPHLYIHNGKKLNESKTIRELGILNNSLVYVVNIKDIQGAHSK